MVGARNTSLRLLCFTTGKSKCKGNYTQRFPSITESTPPPPPPPLYFSFSNCRSPNITQALIFKHSRSLALPSQSEVLGDLFFSNFQFVLRCGSAVDDPVAVIDKVLAFLGLRATRDVVEEVQPSPPLPFHPSVGLCPCSKEREHQPDGRVTRRNERWSQRRRRAPLAFSPQRRR